METTYILVKNSDFKKRSGTFLINALPARNRQWYQQCPHHIFHNAEKTFSSFIINPFQRDPVGTAVPIPELSVLFLLKLYLQDSEVQKAALLHTSHSFGTRENVAATSFSGYMTHA